MDRRLGNSNEPEIRRILDRLTETRPSVPAAFESKQKALMFAAALGHHRRRRTELPSRDAGSAIRFELFQRNIDDGFIHALAAAETKDLKVLDDKRVEEVATCFEEYANAGLHELHDLVESGRAETLDIILDLVMAAQRDVNEDNVPAGLAPEVLSLLQGL
jgi:dnd system-associated protein 4